jgi:hypothetical protein
MVAWARMMLAAGSPPTRPCAAESDAGQAAGAAKPASISIAAKAAARPLGLVIERISVTDSSGS